MCSLLYSTVAKDHNNMTPLEIAVKQGSCKVALYLINHGCGGDKEKANLLCEACDWGMVDVVKELVKKYNIDLNGNCVQEL